MDWAMQRGDPARTGSIGNVPNSNVGGAGDVLWGFETDGYLPTPPIVVDETVLVLGTETLYAVNTTDGTEQWKRRCKPGPGEVVSDGDLAFTTVRGESGKIDTLTAFDLDSGRVLWEETPVEGEMIGHATIHDSQIVILAFESGLYCLDKHTGNVEWTGPDYDGGLYSVDEEFVYIGNSSGTIYGLDRSTGTEVWSLDLGADQEFHPVVAGERIVCWSSSRGLVSVDKLSRKIRWRCSVSGGTHHPSIDDERIYLGGVNGKVVAVNRKDGEHVWTFRADEQVEHPVTTGETIYVPSNDSSVYSINAASGTVNWVYDTESDWVASPAVASGRLFVTHDNHLTALAIKSPSSDRSTRLWKQDAAGDAAGYCAECGTDLAMYGQVNFCPECGAQVPD